jgi:hypothetical protein
LVDTVGQLFCCGAQADESQVPPVGAVEAASLSSTQG